MCLVAMESRADDKIKTCDWSMMMSPLCVLIGQWTSGDGLLELSLDSDWLSTIFIGYKRKGHNHLLAS